MKSCLFIFIFASLWGSCRNRYPSERMLNQAAQLIYSSPQQALKLLDSISQKILKRNARHNLYLLKVHAAYEAYQDISVYPPLSNTARYFQQQGDSTKAGWAYLFTGIMDSKNGYYEKASINLSEATTWEVIIGREYKSWSVFCFLSSAMTRIVKIGTITTKPRLTNCSTYSKLDTAA